MSFSMENYVDVPERLRRFKEAHPDGFLRSEIIQYTDTLVVVRAYAHRSPEDAHPAIGHAKEPIPGKTPYTRDSELENAETSAWGRALAALNFTDFGKIASANEVRARQSDGGARVEPTPTTGSPPATTVAESPPSGTFTPPPAVAEELAAKQASSVPNQDGGVPEEVAITFGKHKGKKVGELVDADSNYLAWLAGEKFEPKSKEQRRVKGAAQTVLGQPLTYHGEPEPVAAGGADYDESIPFAWTWA